MTIHAFTEFHNDYPAFINLGEQPNGAIKVSVRTRGNGGKDYATIELTNGQAEELAEAIFKHVYKDEASAPAPAIQAVSEVALMREQVESAATDAGLVRIKSCCDVPLKYCSTDEWRGDLNAFAVKIFRAALSRTATPAPRNIIELLREARSTLEMWKDVAPAVSLCGDIDKALSSTPAAEGVSEWLPLSEFKPEPECYVLTWNGKVVGVDWWGGVRYRRGDSTTHWLPFAKPPGAGQMYGMHSLPTAPIRATPATKEE